MSGSFFWHNKQTLREIKVQQLHVHAELIRQNWDAIVHARDDGESLLCSQLELQPTIEIACLYDTRGMPVANWRRTAPGSVLPDAQQAGHVFAADGHVDLFCAFRNNGLRVGTVYLRDSGSDIASRSLQQAKLALLATLFSCGLAVLLSMRAHHYLTQPILELVDVADGVTRDGVSHRVNPRSDDEFGKMHRAINRLLDRLERSERSVQVAHNEMEDRVKAKMAEWQATERRRIEADLLRCMDAAWHEKREKSLEVDVEEWLQRARQRPAS